MGDYDYYVRDEEGNPIYFVQHHESHPHKGMQPHEHWIDLKEAKMACVEKGADPDFNYYRDLDVRPADYEDD